MRSVPLTVIRKITRLARTGALDQAWAMLHASGLAMAHDNPRALCLRGRLKKDRAKRAEGAERVGWLEAAAADYCAASKIDGSSYALINAASLSLLAGRKGAAERLAGEVLALLDANPLDAETPYWLEATRAEAYLLLGRMGDARAALRKAIEDAPQAYEDRAATIGQFAMICDELGLESAWLDQFRPPRALHYSGIVTDTGQASSLAEKKIADWLDAHNVGFGFGSLAAGADIWVAEALLQRGAELHFVLPCPLDEFLGHAVRAVDPAFVPRCEQLLANATSIRNIAHSHTSTPAAVALANAVARGRAIDQARILQSSAVGLLVAGEDQAVRAGQGPSRDVTMITAPGVRQAAGHAGAGQDRLQAVLAMAGHPPQVFACVADAWCAATNHLGGERRLALDVQVVADGAQEAARVWATAETMVGQALPGQVLASQDLAFALLAELPGLRIELLGDLRSASGFTPLYALREA